MPRTKPGLFSTPSSQIGGPAVEDEPNERPKDGSVLTTKQAERKPQQTGHCVLDRALSRREHQRRLGWAVFVGRNARSTPHDLPARGTGDNRLSGWGDALVILIVRYLSRRYVSREGIQLPAQGSESLAEARTEKAIVAHFDKASGQDML